MKLDTESLMRVGEEITALHSGLDSQAQEEAGAFKRDALRKESIKSNLHRVIIIFIWIAGVMFFLCFAIRMMHFVLPDGLCWLSDSRIQTIDKSLFSGAIGALIMAYLRPSLPK